MKILAEPVTFFTTGLDLLLRRYRRLGFFTTWLTFTAIVGCSTNDGANTDAALVDMPSAWATTASSSEVETSWWFRFDDQRLNELIDKAQRRNTTIGQADARTRQARAQAQIAGADLLPQLSGVFNASRQKQLVPGTTSNDNTTISESYGASLNISWEIDLWGKLDAQSEAAREDYLSSIDMLTSIRQSIAAQTAKSYFAVIEAREQVAFAEQTVAALTETARQVGNRADQGAISPADKQLAITNLETARGGLAQRLVVEQQLSRQLQTIMREYPSGVVSVPETLPPIPPLPPAGLPAELLQRRPDLLAAERTLRAAGLRTEVASKAFLPAITLNGSAGGQSNELNNLLDGDFSLWSIAGQLVQPIFQGGRLSANLELSRARYAEQAEAYAETVLQALQEVENTLAAERYLADREHSLRTAAEAAENAQRIAFNRYAQGLTPFITVLESQQRALDTRSAWIAVRRARLDNRVDLYLALGGGFSSLQEQTP